jgi:hypothetical protein
MPTQVRGQLGMDEKIVDDKELEAALEQRENDRADVLVARQSLTMSDTKARALIDKLGMEEGDAVRVGRFRITKQLVPAHEVTFEAEESERIRIRTSEG